MSDAPAEVIAQLAPTGVLRAGINMSNFLLVVDKTPSGDPIGPSPSMAAAIAEALGIPLKLVPYDNPSAVAAAAGTGAWDIGNIGAEPQRAAVMDFTTLFTRDSQLIALEKRCDPANKGSSAHSFTVPEPEMLNICPNWNLLI